MGANAEDEDIFNVEADDFPSAAKISAARTIVTPREKSLDPEAAGPSCSYVFRLLDKALFPHTIYAIEADYPPQINPSMPAVVDTDFWQNATNSLRASLALVKEGSAMHIAIKATLNYHIALMAQHQQKIKVAINNARGEARVNDARM